MTMVSIYRVCGCKSMPVAGEAIHVNRPMCRRAWCGLEVRPSGRCPRGLVVGRQGVGANGPGGECGVKDQVSRRSEYLSIFAGGNYPCIKTRRWYARTAELNSCSPQANRNSTRRRASRTSRPVVRAAVRTARPAGTPTAVKRAKCTKRPVLRAAHPRVCPSFPRTTAPSTAASASPRIVGNPLVHCI